MTTEQKQNYLGEARQLLTGILAKMSSEINSFADRLASLKELSRQSNETKLTYETMMAMERRRYSNLQKSLSSPYFYRCLIQYDNESEKREILFGKMPFLEGNIYSWVSPAATMRFETPGNFEYKLDKTRAQKGRLFVKDQYMIVDGKIIFLSSESIESARELIYQEFLSGRKTTFSLPEIVEQMEKQQDEVIRANFSEALVITGPAGSGKTTLALHRIAYLLQAPDTATLFSPQESIVFVSDIKSKTYFSQLLPSLGIEDVRITTFAEWAGELLGLSGYNLLERYGSGQLSEAEADHYEQAKIRALKDFDGDWLKNIYTVLWSAYEKYFTKEQLKHLESQKKNMQVDRVDLTLLLLAFRNTRLTLEIEKEYYQVGKNQQLTRKTKTVPVNYKLMIIDEFQNYLPEQLSLLHGCIDPLTRASLYVGDLRQQVKLGTLRDWSQLPTKISTSRLISINKVYRNTAEILQYLNGLGYRVDLPDGVKHGQSVMEQVLSETDEKKLVKEKITALGEFSVGIIAKEEKYLSDYRETFDGQKNVFVLTMAQAQGLEFDTVFIVGWQKNDFILPADYGDAQLTVEKKKIISDLLYIALTRATTNMYVFGRDKLSESVTGIIVTD